ncbi:MAG: hypothetical protein WCO30_00525 [bacterium]
MDTIFSSPPTGYGQHVFSSVVAWLVRYSAGKDLLNKPVENGQPLLPWKVCASKDQLIFAVVFHLIGNLEPKAKFPGGCKNDTEVEETVLRVVIREFWEEVGYIMSPREVMGVVHDVQFNRETKKNNFFRYFTLARGETLGGCLLKGRSKDTDLVYKSRWVDLRKLLFGIPIILKKVDKNRWVELDEKDTDYKGETKEIIVQLHEQHKKLFVELFDLLYISDSEAKRVIDELYESEPEIKERLDLWR